MSGLFGGSSPNIIINQAAAEPPDPTETVAPPVGEGTPELAPEEEAGTPAEMAAAPAPGDERIEAARQREIARMRGRSGRFSTILTRRRLGG